MTKARLSIGEMSRRTGIPVKTLRFYSDEGLVPPSARAPSGYRLYSEDDIVKVDLVRTRCATRRSASTRSAGCFGVT